MTKVILTQKHVLNNTHCNRHTVQYDMGCLWLVLNSTDFYNVVIMQCISLWSYLIKNLWNYFNVIFLSGVFPIFNQIFIMILHHLITHWSCPIHYAYKLLKGKVFILCFYIYTIVIQLCPKGNTLQILY